MPAAAIDSTSSVRSLWRGTRPSPSTMARYTATTTHVRPASEIVAVSTRSMPWRARDEDPRTRLNGSTTDPAAATSPRCFGQLTRACSPAMMSANAAATVMAQPIHSIRLRSGPFDFAYRAPDAGSPTSSANRISTITGHSGHPGRATNSAIATPAPAT